MKRLEQVDWPEFMWLAAERRPAEPERYLPGSRQYAKAKGVWDAWHAYVAGIMALARDPRTEGLVLYRNTQRDSNAFGQQTVLAYGESRTYKTVERCANGYLNDVPSERQYPIAWVECRDKLALIDIFAAPAVRLDD